MYWVYVHPCNNITWASTTRRLSGLVAVGGGRIGASTRERVRRLPVWMCYAAAFPLVVPLAGTRPLTCCAVDTHMILIKHCKGVHVGTQFYRICNRMPNWILAPSVEESAWYCTIVRHTIAKGCTCALSCLSTKHLHRQRRKNLVLQWIEDSAKNFSHLYIRSALLSTNMLYCSVLNEHVESYGDWISYVLA